MKQYTDLALRILNSGTLKSDRTGTGTLSVFGHQMRFDLRQGFPLLTTKFVSARTVFLETLFFLKGLTDNTQLNELGVRIWDEWALSQDYGDIKQGELGPVYGAMWRRWPNSRQPDQPIDQIDYIDRMLAEHSNSRRLLVSAWEPSVLPVEGVSHDENIVNGSQVLPPCHTLFQFITEPMTLDEVIRENGLEPMAEPCWLPSQHPGYIEHVLKGQETIEALKAQYPHLKTQYLSLSLYQRSGDVPLGIPYNIAAYSFLLALFAHRHHYVAKDFVHTIGDAHVYLNQIHTLNVQLANSPKPLPRLELTDAARDFLTAPITTPLDELVTVVDYQHHGTIRYPDPAV